MVAQAALSLFRASSGDTLVFIHHGALRDAFTPRLIGLGEAVVEEAGAPRAWRGKLAFIMVEAFQNLIRHGVPSASGVPEGTFILRSRADVHRVITCNAVHEQELPSLVEALDRLKEKDAAALKNMFLQGLASEGRSAKGGAGLGLIEMTRRSGHAIAHVVLPGPPGLKRVLMRIALGDAPAEGPGSDAELVELVHEQRIQLAIAGIPGTITLEAMLEAVGEEAGGAGQGMPAVRNALLAATQLIEELGGLGRTPIVLLFSSDAEGAGMTLGAPMGSDEAQRLMDEVAQLATFDPVRLSALYRRSLLDHAGDGLPARLGLIELAYRSTVPLRAFQTPLQDGRVFLALRSGLEEER